MINILLADDEYHVITHISNLLQKIDFCEINMLKTTSGSEALQILSTTHIDIAFLDINMPKVDGLQIAQTLCRQWPDCQIVFLTAYETFDFIYKATQYPKSTYLLKSESDTKILEKAISCCRTVQKQRETSNKLSDIQKKEKQLLLLQEQQLLREIFHQNLTKDFDRFVQRNSLSIHFSLEKKVYLMLMHIKRSPSPLCDPSFYLEKMEYILGNLFHFSFIEPEKGFLLWLFQEKELSDTTLCYFECLKNTLDSFIEICDTLKHQTLSLCLYEEQVTLEQMSHIYQLLYNAYYSDSSLIPANASVLRVFTCSTMTSHNTVSNMSTPPSLAGMAERVLVSQNSISESALSSTLSAMKHALYQGDQEQFQPCLQLCRKYCTTIQSKHDITAIKVYFSIVLIFLDYIQRYQLEEKLSTEITLYPLYFLSSFSDWNYAFTHLQKLSTVIFRLSSKDSNDSTKQLVISVQKYVQNHLAENLNLTTIANQVNYNDTYVSRIFKRHTGVNLSDYIVSCRVEYAKKLLAETDDTVQVISQKTGFHTSQYFSSTFRKATGLSPNAYRMKKQT